MAREPYEFQEFPKWLGYDEFDRDVIAKNAEEEKALLKAVVRKGGPPIKATSKADSSAPMVVPPVGVAPVTKPKV